ncbi:MAG TPA: hypothetical protein VG501_04705 [Rhizomicrobium sp.]|nr:hypothetical protein [Rhizomicrobium sp.]
MTLIQKQVQFRTRAAHAKHEGFLRYAGYRWLKIATALLILVVAAFDFLEGRPGFRLRHMGGTWFGYTTGTIGALLILWLAALGIRKRAMTDGSWSLKAWVSAHVYLGLSLIVIVSLHSGFQFGWNIHTLAYALMMLVILSGVFGVIVYNYLPQKLSENRGETTQKQMQEMIRSLDGRLAEAARPLGQSTAQLVRSSLEKTRIGGNLWQRLSGRQRRCPTTVARTRLTRTRETMTDGPEAAALERVIHLLEQKEAVLKKARRHIQLRSWLEVWLYIHVPATFALIAALTAHIVSVFFYW